MSRVEIKPKEKVEIFWRNTPARAKNPLILVVNSLINRGIPIRVETHPIKDLQLVAIYAPHDSIRVLDQIYNTPEIKILHDISSGLKIVPESEFEILQNEWSKFTIRKIRAVNWQNHASWLREKAEKVKGSDNKFLISQLEMAEDKSKEILGGLIPIKQYDLNYLVEQIVDRELGESNNN